ncbi:MAG: cation:proton antiporter [Gammaproteobacteria bacterium]|nr:cation:proton antiporter [Gammaproteobacteria bacterium]NVK89468.1 cation:proton antiporter [Gammaproteobacteria bacterium]
MQPAIYFQIVIVLVACVLLVAIFRRLRLPTILAYLLIGFMIGQMGFSFFAPNSNSHYIAEVGVVFMLFSLGLEFSIPRVIAMRSQVLGLGSLQVLFAILLYFVIGNLLLTDWRVSLILAAALAMSSTAIVTKQLNDQQETHQRHGTLSIATLLFQDMAAIPLLILVPLLAGSSEQAVWPLLSQSFINGVIAVTVILMAGKYILPRLFHEVAASRSDELFVMTSLAVALVASWFTQLLGLSMALGAFMAGMLLAESQFKHQIETEIRPFRDILLGLFFVSIGSLIKIETIIEHGLLITGLVFLFVTSKFLLTWVAASIMGEAQAASLRSAVILAHAGELGFVLVGLARQTSLLAEDIATIVLTVGVFSMLIATFIIRHNQTIINLLGKKQSRRERFNNDKKQITAATEALTQHVIICGFGRNGQSIKRFLDRLSIDAIVLDLDPIRVNEAATGGEAIFYGDARRRSILHAAKIEQARLVVVTFENKTSVLDLLSVTRNHFPQIPVLVRTKDDQNLETFLQHGATQVVPESLESSLMLVAQVLYSLGLPLRSIIGEIQKVRDDRYQMLQSFFHGGASDMLRVLQTHHEQLHAVILTPESKTVGVALNTLTLPEKVAIESIRRGATALTPPPRDTVLAAGDVVLLSGEPESIEKTEAMLFSG